LSAHPSLLDIVVVANPHRSPLVVGHLGERAHRVSYTPDYPLPALARRHPMAACVYVANPLGAYRCYRGHQDALRLATGEAILVLEDDAVPNRSDWMEAVAVAATLLPRFEIVSLHARGARAIDETIVLEGHRFHTLLPTTRRRLLRSVRMRWCQATLAYVISRAAAQRLVARPWDGLPIDHCLPNEFRFCLIGSSPFDHDRSQGSLLERAR
jgi:hypothetical protein